MTDDNPTVEVELRGVDSIEEASMNDVWIADLPVGKLLAQLRQRIHDLEHENNRLRTRVAALENMSQRVTRPDGGERDD